MASVDGVSAQVRRIAILVTSLDSAAGRQLLLAMPSQLARDVRKAMASLSSIDPEEQRQVLAEFRKQAISSGTPRGASAIEPAPARPTATAAASPSPRAHVASASESSPVRTEPARDPAADVAFEADDEDLAGVDGARPWAQLDVAALTDLLRGERPLVIAVVLSQLQSRRAARLLEQFPREQHRAVLANLARLGEIDPEAMQAIDEHLASRIADYHHRCDSQSESAGRMQELLAAASPELRGHWQEIIADSDHQLATRLGIASAPKAAPASVATSAAAHAAAWSTRFDEATENAAPAEHQAAMHAAADADSEPVVLPFPTSAQSEPAPVAATPAAASNAPAAAAQESAPAITTLDQILELPPRTIARVLAAAHGEVVLLALAGASPSFMQRFTAMLEKSDARALQARLRALGAINLQDIDEAQRRLCELASYIVGQMRMRRPIATASRAAA